MRGWVSSEHGLGFTQGTGLVPLHSQLGWVPVQPRIWGLTQLLAGVSICLWAGVPYPTLLGLPVLPSHPVAQVPFTAHPSVSPYGPLCPRCPQPGFLPHIVGWGPGLPQRRG